MMKFETEQAALQAAGFLDGLWVEAWGMKLKARLANEQPQDAAVAAAFRVAHEATRRAIAANNEAYELNRMALELRLNKAAAPPEPVLLLSAKHPPPEPRLIPRRIPRAEAVAAKERPKPSSQVVPPKDPPPAVQQPRPRPRPPKGPPPGVQQPRPEGPRPAVQQPRPPKGPPPAVQQPRPRPLKGPPLAVQQPRPMQPKGPPPAVQPAMASAPMTPPIPPRKAEQKRTNLYHRLREWPVNRRPRESVLQSLCIGDLWTKPLETESEAEDEEDEEAGTDEIHDTVAQPSSSAGPVAKHPRYR